jgi:site-specific DNA recombinase
MQAIGYVRVSTEGQVTEGISLEAQRARIEAWCTANGYDLLSIEVDAGLSGGRSDNRPALQRALTRVCAVKGALVVYSLSRLARSTKDTIAIGERLSKSGADLVSLSERIDTTSAAGKMFFRLMAVLNEFERDQIAERTKGALLHLKRQGKRYSGRIPFGYDLGADGENLLSNATEQNTVRVIYTLRTERRSLRQIAAELTRRGLASKTGRPWSARAISNILARQVSTVAHSHNLTVSQTLDSTFSQVVRRTA